MVSTVQVLLSAWLDLALAARLCHTTHALDVTPFSSWPGTVVVGATGQWQCARTAGAPEIENRVSRAIRHERINAAIHFCLTR